MSTIVIPAGMSLRQIADRLGVTVDELQQRTGIQNAEAPLAVERRIEVPDGFLRSRKTQRELQDAMSAPSGKRGGMNTWLALDIEQKRTRAAGGMKANKAHDAELEGLAEARRAYLRFEAESNELAIELYGQLTATHSVDVRAQAFAGQSCAFAQRHLRFAEPPERARAPALSAAKAALLADPKLTEARLGMALSLMVDAIPSDLQEGRAELQRALELDPRAASCWAALGELERMADDLDAASAALHESLDADPSCVLALEGAARLALDEDELELALGLLDRAVEATPTYANAHLWRGYALERLGRSKEARESFMAAVENATRRAHRAWMQARIAGWTGDPMGPLDEPAPPEENEDKSLRLTTAPRKLR